MMISIERGLVWTIAVALIFAGVKYGALSVTVENHERMIQVIQNDLRSVPVRLTAIETKLDVLLVNQKNQALR